MKKTLWALLTIALVSAEAVSVSKWEAELKKNDPVLQGRAVRALAEIRTTEADALLKKTVMSAPAPLTRKNAFTVLALRYPPAKIQEVYASALKDEYVPLRVFALTLLTKTPAKPGSVESELIQLAANDKNPQIQQIYSKANWPFYRKTVLLQDRSDWDHSVNVVEEHPLPLKGWKFAKDPKRNGHSLKVPWFSPSFNDGGWMDICVGQYWDNFKVKHYGVAWYRLTFKAPPKPKKYNAVELHFGAIDEAGYVWLNGIYVGDHNLGDAGWNIPFALDVTKEIRWGENNQITVRVYNRAYAGGIWKPVVLKVME